MRFPAGGDRGGTFMLACGVAAQPRHQRLNADHGPDRTLARTPTPSAKYIEPVSNRIESVHDVAAEQPIQYYRRPIKLPVATASPPP